MEDRPDPELERRMRRALLGLALTSNGPVQSLRVDTSEIHVLSHDPIPGQLLSLGDGDAPHLRFRELWENCEDDAAREFTVKRAEQRLAEIQRRPAPWTGGEESLKDLHARIVRYGSGQTVTECAIAARCGPKEVIVARAAAGLDIEYGREQAVELLPPTPRRARARELRDQDVSIPDIARRLGVNPSTIRRDLGLKA